MRSFPPLPATTTRFGVDRVAPVSGPFTRTFPVPGSDATVTKSLASSLVTVSRSPSKVT